MLTGRYRIRPAGPLGRPVLEVEERQRETDRDGYAYTLLWRRATFGDVRELKLEGVRQVRPQAAEGYTGPLPQGTDAPAGSARRRLAESLTEEQAASLLSLLDEADNGER